MMRRSLLASVMLAVFTATLAIHADEPTKTKGSAGPQIGQGKDGQPTLSPAELAKLEIKIRDKYGAFARALQDLADTYAKSSDKSLQAKAVRLRKILEEGQERGITENLTKFIKFLSEQKNLDSTDKIGTAVAVCTQLAKDISEILRMMRDDNGATNKKDERLALEKLLKDIDKVIREEKIIRNRIDTDPDKPKVAEEQGDVKDNTQKIADKAGGKNDKGGEAKNEKGTAKDPGKGPKGENKPNDNKGEASKANAKEAGKGGEKAEAKPAKEGQNDKNPGKAEAKDGKGSENGKGGQSKEAKDSKDGKPAESKDGKGNEAAPAGKSKDDGKKPSQAAGDKTGQTKPGADNKGAEKAGAKDGKGSEGQAKDGKDSKGAEGAKAGQSKDGKAGEAGQAGKGKDDGKKEQSAGDKPGQSKPGDKQAAGKQDDKQGKSKDSKGAEASKAGAAKNEKQSPKSEASNAKAGEQSPKSQDSKPGEAKSGSPSQGQPKSGQPNDDPAAGKSDNKPAPAGNPQDDLATTKKKIQDAIENMQKAKENVEAGKIPEAGKDADQAVKDLEAAKKKLEDLIRQLREEELERTLANLIDRCQKMLAMQTAVLDSTITVHNKIEASPGKKADRDAILASLNLSDDELKIVEEATRAIEVLEGEGSAVAFPEVFRQMREDMKHVQRRLKSVNCDDFTIGLEEDIIETLKDMIAALKKAKKDLEDKKNPPPKPSDAPPPPPQDQKLLEKIQELKMIKAMQLRVNSRTVKYADAFPPGTPMSDQVRDELRELIQRQEQIIDVTNKIAREDNK